MTLNKTTDKKPVDSESLLGKRISAVGLLLNRSSSSIVQALKEAGYDTTSYAKIKKSI